MAARKIQNADDTRRIVRRRGRYGKAAGRKTEQQYPIGVYPRFSAKRDDGGGDVLSRYSPDGKIIPIVARSGECFGKSSLRTTKATAHDRYGGVTALRKRQRRTKKAGRRLLSHRGTKGLPSVARRPMNQHDQRRALKPIRANDRGFEFHLPSIRKSDRHHQRFRTRPGSAVSAEAGQSRTVNSAIM